MSLPETNAAREGRMKLRQCKREGCTKEFYVPSVGQLGANRRYCGVACRGAVASAKQRAVEQERRKRRAATEGKR
jgi:predicted RNA-binding Zn ribbon-like protein